VESTIHPQGTRHLRHALYGPRGDNSRGDLACLQRFSSTPISKDHPKGLVSSLLQTRCLCSRSFSAHSRSCTRMATRAYLPCLPSCRREETQRRHHRQCS
ncbi:unnamed protein product, partial [Ectocarpus sp. 12 AP-2014]